MSTQNNNKISSKLKTLLNQGFLTINDLRDKEYNNQELTTNERVALKNFDRYRIKILSQKITEKEFNNSYQKLQVMANLSPFDEFLKEEYYS